MPAWWDSPDALGAWITRATLAGIVCAVLAAVSGAATLMLRNRRDAVLAVPSRLAAAEAALAPWRLTDAQEEVLFKALAPFTGSKIMVSALIDAQAKGFAESLTPVLKRAGFEVDSRTHLSSGRQLGVLLVVRSIAEAPPYSVPLQRAFTACGLEAGAVFEPEQPAGLLTVRIGYKPPPKSN